MKSNHFQHPSMEELAPYTEVRTSRGWAILLGKCDIDQLLKVGWWFPYEPCLEFDASIARTYRIEGPDKIKRSPGSIIFHNLSDPQGCHKLRWCRNDRCFNPHHRTTNSALKELERVDDEEGAFEECRLLMLEIDTHSLEIIKNHLYMEEFDADLIERVFQTI